MSECLSEEQKKYIDIDAALLRVRGNVSLYTRLLKMYLVSEEFDAFENHLAANDYAKACDTIHSIKGLSGNLSLTLLFELSGELNKQLKDGVAPNPETLALYRNVNTKTKEVVSAFLANG